MDNPVERAREQLGFLTADQLLGIVGSNNLLLDERSVLIGSGVAIGEGNTFYPNVVIANSGEGAVEIGNDNIFYPGTYLLSSVGSLCIGSGNEFGTGGCTIKANMPDVQITIGDGGRYSDGANIMGQTTLGSGSQVLGNITVQGCELAGGGTYAEADPDRRAAVLKGFGLARGIVLRTGQVVNGSGNFCDAVVEWQRAYHPKPNS